MILHIVERPRDLTFRRCRHKPTEQEYAVLPHGGSVETIHGTMTFRKGDRLIVGSDGHTLYALTPEAFKAVYEELK
jgi:hypothetical protein